MGVAHSAFRRYSLQKVRDGRAMADAANKPTGLGQLAEPLQGRTVMPPVVNPGQRPRALAAAVSLARAASGAHAATFRVTSREDAGPGPLRPVIYDPNSQAAPHVIEMSAITGDTITLASGLPQIYGEDVELLGSQVTLSGDNQHECLGVEYAALSVADITVTECSYSGIRAYASDLEVSDSTITGNNSIYGGGIDALEDRKSVAEGE